MVASVNQSELPTAITQPKVPKEEKKKRAKKNTKTFIDMWIRRLRPPKSGQELYWDTAQKGLALLRRNVEEMDRVSVVVRSHPE